MEVWWEDNTVRPHYFGLIWSHPLSKLVKVGIIEVLSVVGIATGYRLDDQGVGVLVPVGQELSLLHIVHTGSGVHPTSCPMGTGGSFFGGKAAGA
jgi:hypothetical protein